MPKRIPTYALHALAKEEKTQPQDILLMNYQVESPEALDVPHRTAYYGIGLCIRGEAKITANLENYTILPGSLIAMSPHVVKQWLSKTEDFETIAVLFTDSFFDPSGGDGARTEFQFFQSIAKNVFPLFGVQTQQIRASLEFIHGKYAADLKYKAEIVKKLIQALLFEVASLYEQYEVGFSAVQTRGQWLAAAFKDLVKLDFLKERTVGYYAEKLFITPRHLTETVREITGRTPGEWIAEAVILESKVLLKDADLTIAAIADQLSFPDASTFGKYFKNIVGLSPAQYRTSH